MMQQARIITTKKGYESVVKLLKHYESAKIYRHFINENTCKFYGDLVYFKWNKKNSFSFIQTIISTIMMSNTSYSMCIKKENEIKLFSNILARDQYKNIPLPVMICKIDDEKTEQILEEIVKKKGRRTTNGV